MTRDLRPGDPVYQRYRKFDGSPHWNFDTTYLGDDRFGTWIGGEVGAVMERPGRRVVAPVDWVGLIPRGEWFVATFNAPGSESFAHTYIDLASVAEWDGNTVRAIDLDLDVVREFDGRTFIDDEDEFEDHRVAFGYPADLVTTVRATAEQLLTAVTSGAEPFGSVHTQWYHRWVDLRAQRSPYGNSYM